MDGGVSTTAAKRVRGEADIFSSTNSINSNIAQCAFQKASSPLMPACHCHFQCAALRALTTGMRARRRNALVGVPASLTVLLVLMIFLTGCGDSVDSVPEPPRPPGFDQLEPAVRDQFFGFRDRLARARANVAPAPEIGRAWGELG